MAVNYYQYYRVYVTKFCRSGSQVNYCSFAEFGLWDNDGNRLTDSIGYTATASSTGEGSVSNMFDDSSSTIWHSVYSGSSASYTNWVQVYFEEPVCVTSYGLMPRTGTYSSDVPYSWVFQASNDGSTWVDLDSHTDDSSGWSGGTYRTFETGLTPFSVLYLVGDTGGTFYTVVDDALSELADVTELTADVFSTYGVSDIPSGDLLITLDSPSVYAWTDDETAIEMTASVTATPLPQTVLSQNIDMTDSTITGIESVDIVSDSSTLFAMSFDGGTTWYNYVDSAWVELSESTSGQTYDTIAEISTTAWAEMATTGTFMFRWVLSSTDNYVTSITVNFTN